MKLTQKERERLLRKDGVPKHLTYWARQISLDPNPTEQQLLTVRELFDIKNAYVRNQYWIFEDKLRLTEVSYHTIPRKKVHS
jgi:hypothetical protein